MTTQNMKLLDLQTGKYLKIGEKGFFYGGKTITCPPTKSFDIQNVRDMTLHIYADTEKDYDIKCLDDSLAPLFEITLKSNNKKLIGREVRHIDMRFNRVIEQTEPPLELKEICEKVGAVVYGGRYVLLMSFEYQNKEIKVGDIITAQTITTSKDSISMKQYANQIVCFRGNTAFEHSGYNMGFVICENLKCFGINGFWKHRAFDYEERKLEINFNLFEEYSKKLRKEPNKFDELKEYFK